MPDTIVKTSRFIDVLGKPQHCASICFGDNGGPLIAGYVGQEMTDEQQVFVTADNHIPLFMPFKTGNPVLWNDEDGKTWMLFSKFEDKAPDGSVPNNIVQRWMYCSNWLTQIEVLISKVIICHTPRRVDSMFGMLARCQPLKHGFDTLIPMYREKDPLCVLYKFRVKAGEFEEFSTFGKLDQKGYLGQGVAIQPTLFHQKGLLWALCRNCSFRKADRRAWLTSSADDGKTWSDLVLSQFPNNNSSIVALDNDWFVVNAADKRQDMCLVKMTDVTKSEVQRVIPLHYPIEPLSGAPFNFGYPNFVKGFGDYHIVHTNCGYIAHHQIPEELLA